MDALALYRAEAARRGMARKPVTLSDLAERAGITRRALLYQMRAGLLEAKRTNWTARRWQWVVEPAEADRWLKSYRKHARTTHLRSAA